MSMRLHRRGVLAKLQSTAGVVFGLDPFTDTAATLLTAHTPTTGGAWERLDFDVTFTTRAGINIQISSAGTTAVSSSTSPSPIYRLTGTPPSANYKVSSDLQLGGTVATVISGVAARLTATGTAKTAVDGYAFRADPTAGVEKFELVKFLSNVAYVLDSFSEVMDTVNTHAAEISCTNSLKKGSWDGTQKVSSVDNDVTQVGRAGFNTPRSGGGRTVNNFSATSL